MCNCIAWKLDCIELTHIFLLAEGNVENGSRSVKIALVAELVKVHNAHIKQNYFCFNKRDTNELTRIADMRKVTSETTERLFLHNNPVMIP